MNNIIVRSINKQNEWRNTNSKQNNTTYLKTIPNNCKSQYTLLNPPLTIQFNHGQQRHPPRTSTTTASTLNYKRKRCPKLQRSNRSRTSRRRYTSTRLGYNHSVMPVNCVINDERG